MPSNILVTYQNSDVIQLFHLIPDKSSFKFDIYNGLVITLAMPYTNVAWLDDYYLFLVASGTKLMVQDTKRGGQFTIQDSAAFCAAYDAKNALVYTSYTSEDSKKRFIKTYKNVATNPGKAEEVSSHEVEVDKCDDVCSLRKCEVFYSGDTNDALLLLEFKETDGKRNSFVGLYNMQKVTKEVAPEVVFTYTIYPVVESWLLDTTNEYLYITESTGFIYQFDVKSKVRLVQ